MVIKLSKVKEKDGILETAGEKDQITYTRIPIKVSADFLGITLQARRD